MSYSPHTPDEVRAMLERIGARSVRELFEGVPASLRSRAELKLPRPLSERALFDQLRSWARENRPVSAGSSFLGAGAYHHFIPSAVDALASRGEFATSYTPYQAEISQGTLQAIYEFQTLVCQLTGLEVANASLYDGASATAEGVLMGLRISRRRRVLLSAGLHPHYAAVVRTYAADLDVELETLPLGPDGRTQPTDVADDVAAVVVQQPNFFGVVEDLAALATATQSGGARLVSSTAEAFAFALLRPPGELGVDVACGEAQSFGLPLSFGGPYAGLLATRKALVRQMPGRLIGETVDTRGERAFVMTLTAREQHIRRERATSNICTNQGLCALRVTIFLALLGKQGLRQVALQNLALAHYAREALARAGLSAVYSGPTFNEFAVRVPELGARLERASAAGIAAGVPLEAFDATRADQLLVCVTEMNARAEIDELARVLAA